MKKFFLILMAIVICSGCGQREESSTSTQSESSRSAAMQKGTNLTREMQMKKAIDQGVEYLSKENIQGAIQSFDEAIRLNPQDPRGYVILGEVYMRLKSHERAIDTLSAGLNIAPENIEINYLLGLAYGFQGDKNLAVHYAQRSIDLSQKQQDGENFKKSLALLHSLSTSK